MNNDRDNLATERRTGTARHSPHVVNLRGAVPEAVILTAPRPYRGPFAWLRRPFDEFSHHGRDRAARSLSVRERGWRDFPPAEAKNLGHAVAVTANRFVEEHPYADLTVVSVLHFAVLMFWRLFAGAPKPAGGRTEPTRAMSPLRAVAEKTGREAPPKASWKLSLERPAGFRRAAASFAVIASLVILPLGTYGSITGGMPVRELMQLGTDAAKSLVSAAQAAESLDFEAANAALRDAEEGFGTVSDALGSFGRAVSYAAAILPTKSSLAAAGPLLDAGHEAAKGGVIVTDAMRRVAANPDLANTEKIRLLDAALAAALPHFENANAALAAVPEGAVPEAYRDRVAQAKAEMPRALALLRSASPALQFLATAAGGEGPRRYLVLFQNNAELRATGGFIGSFAVLDVRDGKIEKMDIPGGGSYDLQGQLTLKLSSPQPLHLVNPRWQFQDGNWFADYPTSARFLARLYEHGGGTTVDGVVAVNMSVMQRLLAVLGPVEMPEYGKTIDADNFFLETQKAVEVEYDKEENRPKQFLADLAPKVLDRLLAADTATAAKAGGALLEAVQSKELLVWMRYAEEQAQVARLGWDGAVRQDAGDFLMVVHSNIAGQKSDIMMGDKLDHATKILPDGTAIVTLTVTRTHHGEKRALFTGVRNVDYVRFLVPRGSELVAASGFEAPDPKLFDITEDGLVAEETVAAEERDARYDRDSGVRVSVEANRTAFGGWLQTDPGESSVATLTYRLPAGLVAIERAQKPETLRERIDGYLGETPVDRMSYSLTVEKQPGANPAEVTASVELPQGWYAVTGEERAETTLERDFTFRLDAESIALSQ